ncbi:hypothetical protein HDU82_006639 [Entophlyctis luteolus]|nr:hypothetical protein HDU82_006639 [Entophlyctis luteolus]
MDRYYYDEVKAASAHPGLTVRMWGPGWPGYDDKLDASENIALAFPNVRFDVIYTKTRHHQVASDSAVVVHATADCHDFQCVQPEFYPMHADAITFRYAGEILELARPEQWRGSKAPAVGSPRMPLFFHSPDCADDGLLHPAEAANVPRSASARSRSSRSAGDRWAEQRPTLIRLIGHSDATWYPLRNRVRQGIESGEIANASVYRHVGYVLQSLKNAASVQQQEVGVFDPYDPAVEHHRQNQRAWAAVLASTQICVFDSSILRKAIRKFHESFMSGCVVASDIPLEMEDIFKDVVIPLEPDMTPGEINNILQVYLADKERLAWMAMEAFKRARMHWTCRNKVDRLLEAAERVVRGDRGYWFPFGFSGGCRRFGKGDSKRTEWCK